MLSTYSTAHKASESQYISFATDKKDIKMEINDLFLDDLYLIYCYIIIYYYPSIHFLYPLNPLVGSRGGWSLSQRSSSERRGTPCTGRQSITGSHRDKQPHTFTLTHSLLWFSNSYFNSILFSVFSWLR